VAVIDVYCWLHETVIFCVEEIILGIVTPRFVSTLRVLHVLKMIDFERKLLFSALLMSDFFFCYFDMCLKDTDILIENNVQPILVFQKTLERKAKCGILLR